MNTSGSITTTLPSLITYEDSEGEGNQIHKTYIVMFVHRWEADQLYYCRQESRLTGGIVLPQLKSFRVPPVPMAAVKTTVEGGNTDHHVLAEIFDYYLGKVNA